MFRCSPDRLPRPLLRKHAPGFTLLEVLVALVILAVALVALTHTAGRQTEAFEAARQRTLAGWVAANALTDLRLQPGLPPTGQQDGRESLAGQQWPWRAEISSTQAAGIRQIRVAVYAPGNDPNRGARPVQVLNGFAGNQLQP